MGIYIPPPAPVSDPAKAVDALWAFVEGIGFDPNKVLSAFETRSDFQVGFAIGGVHSALSKSISEDISKFWEFDKSKHEAD
ncbi:MAG: hypothetical protein IT497_04825 [Ottowia sp.]|jgi:hypothetical protein|nr:hypothetical protein [Ottowia sp.]